MNTRGRTQGPTWPPGPTGSPERYLTWAIMYSGSIRAGAAFTTGFKITATCFRSGDRIWPGDRGYRNTGGWLSGLPGSEGPWGCLQTPSVKGLYSARVCYPLSTTRASANTPENGDLVVFAVLSPGPSMVSGTW